MSLKVIKDNLYPGWQEYVGMAETCIVNFSIPFPDQLDWFFGWYVDRTISAAQEAVEQEGGHILRTVVLRDKAPTWETKYQIQITAHASPLAWFIVVGIMFLILAIVVAWVYTVKEVPWGEVIPEVPKAMKWGAIALIGGGVCAVAVAAILSKKKSYG